MKAPLLLAALLITAIQLNAQTNIALTATATHSSGGTGTLGPKNYNDNVIPSCTGSCSDCKPPIAGQVDGGKKEWIEYRWATPQTFDEVVFYFAYFPLLSTTLQYWNGTKYENIVKYNTARCPQDAIKFAPVTTTRLRFYGIDAGTTIIWGIFTVSIPGTFREIQVIQNVLPCNGMPAPGLVSGTSPSGALVCKGTPVKLTVSGASVSALKDINYQWQRREIRAIPGTWSNITGATGMEYEGDTLMGWEYRFVAFCTVTNDTGYTATYSLPQGPEPAVSITPPGPISVCDGDTAWLTASNYAGGVYTWMKDGVPVYGWKFSDFGATEAGIYTVKVETADPCPGYSQPVKVGRTDPGFSTRIAPFTDSILCEGETIMLFGVSSKPFLSYQWRRNNIPIPGATAFSYTVKTSGYYKVLASDGSDCPAASRSTFITVHPKPAADIAVPGETLTACEGKGVLLVSSDAYEYQWSFNGNPVVGWNEDSLLVKNSGRYTVKVRSAYGCVNTSAPISVSILPAPVPVISKSGLVLSTSAGFAFYTWKRNGTETVSSGAGKSSFKLVKKGLYTVTVTDGNGCEGTSDPIEAFDATLAIGNTAAIAQEIQIYPNPANEKVFIKSPVPVNVKVENITGQLLYSGDKVTEVSLDGYAGGLYLFTITDQEGNTLAKQKIYKMAQ